jgi:hypothetical protein
MEIKQEGSAGPDEPKETEPETTRQLKLEIKTEVEANSIDALMEPMVKIEEAEVELEIKQEIDDDEVEPQAVQGFKSEM